MLEKQYINETGNETELSFDLLDQPRVNCNNFTLSKQLNKQRGPYRRYRNNYLLTDNKVEAGLEAGLVIGVCGNFRASWSARGIG